MQNILSSITSEYYVKTRAPISKQVIFILANVQLYGGLKSHVFTDITMFTYSRPVKCNVKILNVRKYPANVFGLIVLKIAKTNTIVPLWKPYYMPLDPQNTIIQTEIKHYNKLKSVKTKALRWFEITTDTGNKIKV